MEKKYKFDSYFKYEFLYLSEDGDIYLGGGDSGDIYRSALESEMTLAELERELGENKNKPLK